MSRCIAIRICVLFVLPLTMMRLCCRVEGKLRFVRLQCCKARNGMPRLNVNIFGGLPYQIEYEVRTEGKGCLIN